MHPNLLCMLLRYKFSLAMFLYSGTDAKCSMLLLLLFFLGLFFTLIWILFVEKGHALKIANYCQSFLLLFMLVLFFDIKILIENVMKIPMKNKRLEWKKRRKVQIYACSRKFMKMLYKNSCSKRLQLVERKKH